MLQVGISQDWQLSAPGLTREPELPVLVYFVLGKDGGRESSRNGPPLGGFLHTLGERGLPSLPFWSIGKEIGRSCSWDLDSVSSSDLLLSPPITSAAGMSLAFRGKSFVLSNVDVLVPGEEAFRVLLVRPHI